MTFTEDLQKCHGVRFATSSRFYKHSKLAMLNKSWINKFAQLYESTNIILEQLQGLYSWSRQLQHSKQKELQPRKAGPVTSNYLASCISVSCFSCSSATNFILRFLFECFNFCHSVKLVRSSNSWIALTVNSVNTFCFGLIIIAYNKYLQISWWELTIYYICDFKHLTNFC